MEDSQRAPGRHELAQIIKYWHDNQVAVVHHTRLAFDQRATFGESFFEASLDALNSALQKQSGFQLEALYTQDIVVPAPTRRELADHSDINDETKATASIPSSSQSPVGPYFFPHPSDEGTLVVSFFQVKGADEGCDGTTEVVQLINKDPDDFTSSPNTRLIATMPNWIYGSTSTPQIIIVGCPAVPPMPISAEEASQNWHIELPVELPDAIRNATGKGVRVFVLDTLPDKAQIATAVGAAANNTLLHDVVANVTFQHNPLPPVFETPSPSQPATGVDIYGNTVGLPMSDHGIFIAGIIRDLAPDAQVECIRVLNDYGVGDVTTLMQALQSIQNRMLSHNPDTQEPGDLYQSHERVVINLSMTIPPPREWLDKLGYTEKTDSEARLGLLYVMQALAKQGVVFTASAGNGSGPHEHIHDHMTNPMPNLPGKRVRPCYPAAYAYPLPGLEGRHFLPAMIPVGAVNQAGGAANYSNYPGHKGIGAYGGELPHPLPEHSNPATVTQVQFPIDALRGVYTNTFYPRLSKDDPPHTLGSSPNSYPTYQPTPAATWAYWVGTSFSTPIISALAARVLETQPSVGDSVRDALRAAAPAEVDWTNLDTGEDHVYGPMILTWQEAVK